MDNFERLLRDMLATLLQAYAVRSVIEAGWCHGSEPTFSEALEMSARSNDLAQKALDGIVGRAKGNRKNGTPCRPEDIALMYAAVHRKCLEVLEKEHATLAPPDAGD